jgi:molecular chaperone GrpE
LALRHEVNLQTRAVRNQQEQNAATLQQLTQALEDMQALQAAAQRAQAQNRDEGLRPLLETLVDLHDALSRAGREFRRGEDLWAPLLERAAAVLHAEAADQPADTPFPSRKPSIWDRLLGRAQFSQTEETRAEREQALNQRRQRARETSADLSRVGQALSSLAAGYTMSLQRIERALAQHGLEPIAAEGQPFDPECMEVVEAVPGSDRPSGEVLEEVRRGYWCNGRIFRYAQVRVAKG